MNEINQQKKNQVQIFLRSILTGFVGGIVWTGFATLLYYFNFIQVSPGAILLRTWLSEDWASKWQGEVLAIFLAGFVSIILAIIYFLILRKRSSMWVGVIYGVVLWAVVQFLWIPILYHIPPINEQSMDAIITTICVYILYGLFIGFSISYDYHDTLVKEQKGI